MLILRLHQLLSTLRFRPFDTSTEQGRSKERYRRAMLTSLASMLARGINFLAVLITVPLCKHYLGDERYGVWLTIASIIAMLNIADLGIGNGLISLIAGADGRGDEREAASYVSSAFIVLTLVSVAIGLVYAIAYPFVSFASLLKIQNAATCIEARQAFTVLLLNYLVGTVIGIVFSVQIGYQEGFGVQWWICLGGALGLVGVLVAVYLEASLPWLAMASSGGPTLAKMANAVYFFGFRRPALLPRATNISKDAAKKILGSGLLFMALQAAVAIGYNSDNVVIARVLGANVVPQYAVPSRLFQILIVVMSALIMPLWPAYGEAITRGDVPWIRRTLRRTVVYSLWISTPLCVLMVVFGKQIIRIWLGDDSVQAPYGLLVGMAIWTLTYVALSTPLGMFYNGLHVYMPQVITSLLMAAMNIAISIALTRVIGVAGPVWGSIISQSICILIPAYWLAPWALRTKQFARAGINPALVLENRNND